MLDISAPPPPHSFPASQLHLPCSDGPPAASAHFFRGFAPCGGRLPRTPPPSTSKGGAHRPTYGPAHPWHNLRAGCVCPPVMHATHAGLYCVSGHSGATEPDTQCPGTSLQPRSSFRQYPRCAPSRRRCVRVASPSPSPFPTSLSLRTPLYSAGRCESALSPSSPSTRKGPAPTLRGPITTIRGRRRPPPPQTHDETAGGALAQKGGTGVLCRGAPLPPGPPSVGEP